MGNKTKSYKDIKTELNGTGNYSYEKAVADITDAEIAQKGKVGSAGKALQSSGEIGKAYAEYSKSLTDLKNKLMAQNLTIKNYNDCITPSDNGKELKFSFDCCEEVKRFKESRLNFIDAIKRYKSNKADLAETVHSIVNKVESLEDYKKLTIPALTVKKTILRAVLLDKKDKDDPDTYAISGNGKYYILKNSESFIKNNSGNHEYYILVKDKLVVLTQSNYAKAVFGYKLSDKKVAGFNEIEILDSQQNLKNFTLNKGKIGLEI